MPERRYGKPEGLRERLEDWVERMSKDKSLPWAGLGIIDDLKLTITLLPTDLPDAPAKPAIQDYDL